MNRRSRLVFACDAPHGGLTGRGQAFEFDRQAFAPSCFLKPRQEPYDWRQDGKYTAPGGGRRQETIPGRLAA